MRGIGCLVIVVAWSVACGSDDGAADSPASGGAQGDAAGAAGGAVGSGGTDSGGGASAGAGSGGADSGTLGTGGSAAGAAGGDAGPRTCAALLPDNVALEQNGAEVLREGWETTSIGGTASFLILQKRNRGYAWFNGAFAPKPYDSPPGDYPVTLGALLAPSSSSQPGSVICVAPGRYEVTSLSAAVRSSTAKILGACPGDPVSGSLEFCGGGSCTAPSVKGSLDGKAPTDINGSTATGFEAPPDAYIDARSDEFFVRAYTDAEPDSGSGDVELAVIFTLPSSAYAGAVYCAGTGSTWTAIDGGVDLKLESLSKLGECLASPGDGELLFCL